jgi:hypothetical protein
MSAITESRVWHDLLHVGEAGIAFGFYGLICGGGVEAFRSIRDQRPARWGEPTIYGTVLFGAFGAAVEGLHIIGVPFV